MTRTLLTLALVAVAGTAGAQTVNAPATGGVKTGVSTPGMSTSAGTATQMNSSGNAQMNSNAQINSNAQMNSSAGASMANAPAPRLTGAAGTAQKRIEQDGYKNVQNLAKGADGLWHGTAMRGGTQVQVTVDRAGNVTGQ